jgi:hypothetical protein
VLYYTALRKSEHLQHCKEICFAFEGRNCIHIYNFRVPIHFFKENKMMYSMLLITMMLYKKIATSACIMATLIKRKIEKSPMLQWTGSLLLWGKTGNPTYRLGGWLPRTIEKSHHCCQIARSSDGFQSFTRSTNTNHLCLLSIGQKCNSPLYSTINIIQSIICMQQ